MYYLKRQNISVVLNFLNKHSTHILVLHYYPHLNREQMCWVDFEHFVKGAITLFKKVAYIGQMEQRLSLIYDEVN